jgi:hypothetical protein
MRRQVISLLISGLAALAAILLIAPSASAAPAPSLRVSSASGAIQARGVQAEVTLQVTCAPDNTARTEGLELFQRRNGKTQVNGGVGGTQNVTCDGTPQTVTYTVQANNGFWKKGEAGYRLNFVECNNEVGCQFYQTSGVVSLR